VRNVAWIMDSFERLVRRNAFEPSTFFATPEERATVYSRTEALAHRDRVVGFAYSALKEAYYGEYSDHRLLIDYDILG
jgi:sulfotransferase